MSARESSETFASDLVSVRDGRHFVRDTLQDWGLDGIVDDAQLCVSEIITNAVCHAGSGVTVSVRCDDELCVDVRDDSPMPAGDVRSSGIAAEPADPDATSGRGLHIVSILSRTWGVRAEPAGKVVWFRLALPSGFDEQTESDDTESDDTVVDIRSRRAEDEIRASSARHPSSFGHART